MIKDENGKDDLDIDMTKYPKTIDKLTKEQLDAELEKGYADMLAGRVKPLADAFEEIRKSIKK